MSLKQQIDNDIKKAMLARSKEELEALRSIKSLILLAETIFFNNKTDLTWLTKNFFSSAL